MINKELVSIDPRVNVDIDPTLMRLLANVFTYANDMGLKGHRMLGFDIVKGSLHPFDHPQRRRHKIICLIEEKEPEKPISSS